MICSGDKKVKVAVVWFKRDLRVFDHAPLKFAVESGLPVLPVYFIEPAYWQQPDVSLRQWRFVKAALHDLACSLQSMGLELQILNCPAVFGFREVLKNFQVDAVFSHQETGNNWTYQRDKDVGHFLKEAGIFWYEYQHFGVMRGHFNRNKWADKWMEYMTLPLDEVISQPLSATLDLPAWFDPVTQVEQPLEKLQKPTRAAGLHCLKTFLYKRGIRYAGGISSPNTAWSACSRLSPYLAYGLLSIREVYQASVEAILFYQKGSDRDSEWWLRSLENFQSRLFWHCHFIQKLEIDPAIEYKNMLSLADNIRPRQSASCKKLSAWVYGETGYPLIDACMRALRANGWINFRMRAMLVSFASYQLWLDWRDFGPILARLFVDYEPGIHYSQLQMQSGTTGINAMRVYNPVKQSKDLDPKGYFIKKWLPELRHLSHEHIHEPYLMSAQQQQTYGVVIGHDYPSPIVNNKTAMKLAKDKIYALRKHPDYKKLSQSVFTAHGSRKKN